MVLGCIAVAAALLFATAAAATVDTQRISALAQVKQATRQYRSSPSDALEDGYFPVGECEGVPGEGTSGARSINFGLFDTTFDIDHPEGLLYRTLPNGRQRLAGVAYVVADADQDPSTTDDRPTLGGQPFNGPIEGHEAGMPLHYELNVWVWYNNPTGMFAPFNPRVECAVEAEHGLVFDLGGEGYYMAGPADGPDGARDIPGHTWIQRTPKKIEGYHYNTGPFGAPSWWSSDADDGELLYEVEGRIDKWTASKAASYARRGFVHYHEFVSVETGEPHPTLVVWLKHNAVTSFTLDGGPHPELAHSVSPGIDREFIPNGSVPYNP